MDRPWSRDDWNPTAGVFPELGFWEKPSKNIFKKAKEQLATSAKNVREHRHEPKFWFERGTRLHKLGYPELAAGDFEKTLMLIEYGLDFSSILGEDVRKREIQELAKRDPSSSPENIQQAVTDSFKKLRKNTYVEYVDTLFLMRALPDILDMCKEALMKHPGDLELKDLLNEAQESHSDLAKQVMPMLRAQGMSLGEFAWSMTAIKSYPWALGLQKRDEKNIADANTMLRSCSDCLEIRASSLGETECFGMFAKRDIKKGERILHADCATGTSSKPVGGRYCYNCAARLDSNKLSLDCCPNMQFCSEVCLEIAKNNYHEILCGKDFSKLYEAASSKDFAESSKARDGLVFLRLFAISIQAGTPPLETPPLSWLGANYESQAPIPWSRQANITHPLKILQTLNMDIFAEQYDTWKLQTMWNRVSNNSRTHTGPLRQKVVNPMFSFFNHSCDPTAMDQTELVPSTPKTSRCIMLATKDIKSGEEVCTTYVDPRVLSMAKTIREQQLNHGPWFGRNGCQCPKCQTGR